MVKIRTAFITTVIAGCLASALPALAADGYDGLTAPADDSKDAPAKAGNDASPGYSGVVADPSSTPAAEPEAAEQYTPRPYSTPPRDLETRSMINGIISRAPAVEAPKVDFSSTQHNFVAGKPAAQFAMEQRIKQAMDGVNDKNLSDSARADNAKNAYKNLGSLADGLRSKQAIPDDTYKSMGLTDAYINDEKTGNAAALTQLDAALAALKPYQ